MRERRKYPRLRVLKSAKLVLAKSTSFACVVRDLTIGGARIEIPNTIDLPKELEVAFDGGSSRRPCRLVWRTISVAGLEFLDIGASVGQSYESATQGQQESAAVAACPKCQSGMAQVAITPHPVAPRMRPAAPLQCQCPLSRGLARWRTCKATGRTVSTDAGPANRFGRSSRASLANGVRSVRRVRRDI
jgi:PilZ domain